MQKTSIFTIKKGTITVILIMTVIVVVGLLIAYFHYGKINNAEDPRVINAKLKYKNYNLYVQKNDSKSAFLVLDSIENIYLNVPDYVKSYEIGVVYNNKSAIWLNSALLKISEGNDAKSDLDSAQKYVEKSISIYKNWLAEFGELSEAQISTITKSYYDKSDKSLGGVKFEDMIDKRIEDLVLAQKETPKRLSVSYTNLGIVQRHRSDYTSAMDSYKKALTLWKGNREAKNNINILLGRPIEDMTILEKIFPEEK